MEQVFWKLLNMSISASWLVLAVVVLRPLLKKAPKALRCALWGLVGLRLLLPVSIESVLSLIPSAETVPANIAMMPVPAITSGIAAVNSAVNPALAQSMTPAAGASVNPMQVWSFVAAWVWGIGMALMLLYALGSALWLRRRVRTAVRWEDNVWQSEGVGSPFVFGLFRPRIYLPFGLSDEERQSVLAHERAHLARRDHLIKPLGFLLLSIYWFNPVLWLAYVLLCRDIELACDEKVIRDMDVTQRKAYSAALLKCSVHRSLAACPLAFGEVGVKQRVKSVLHYKKPAFWLIVLAVAVGIVLAVCFLTDPVTPEKEAKEDEISVAGGITPTSYVYDRAIYTNPLSAAIGPTGYRYVVGQDSFTVVDQTTGEVISHHKNLTWDWEPLTQKQLEELLFEENETALKEYFGVNIRDYKNPRIYAIADLLQLMDMDGELWLWDGRWRIYALAPESEKYQLLAEADLSHDGEDDRIFWCDDPMLGPCLWVFEDDGRLLWDWSFGDDNAYYLCTLNSENYLLHYRTRLAGGSAQYSYELFYTDGNERNLGKQTVKSRMLEFSLSGDMDSWEMVDFADEVNELLSHSTLLISTQDGYLRLGPEAGANDWERYEFLDECAELYAPGDDLKMRIEVYADYQRSLAADEGGLAPMLTRQLLNLAWQERELSWEDLRPYAHEDIGSGRHVYMYEAGVRFQLIVSSNDPDTSMGIIDGDIALIALVDGEEVTWDDGDMADFIFRKLSRDTSPLIVSGRSCITAVGAESSVQPSVLYIDSAHAERYDGPFTVYINGEDYDAGLYSVRETQTGENVDVFMPSGLSQRLFVLQNTQPGRLYEVSLQYYDAQAKLGKTAMFRVMTEGT